MVHWEFIPKKRKIVYAVLLLLPLAISVIWLVYIKIQAAMGISGFLSPENNRPVLVALIIFAVGYLFFLGLLFSNNIKEWYEDRRFRKNHGLE